MKTSGTEPSKIVENHMKMGGKSQKKKDSSSTINHSHGIINIALFISNGQELRDAIGSLKGDNDSYSYPEVVICALSLSMLLQALIGYLVIVFRNTDSYDVEEEEAGSEDEGGRNAEGKDTAQNCHGFHKGILSISFTITILNSLAFILANT